MLHYIIFQNLACNCNTQGSNNGNTCDNNGVCSCKANVVNDKCDACAPGYGNFPACDIGKKYYTTYPKSFITLMQLY